MATTTSEPLVPTGLPQGSRTSIDVPPIGQPPNGQVQGPPPSTGQAPSGPLDLLMDNTPDDFPFLGESPTAPAAPFAQALEASAQSTFAQAV